MMEYTRMAKQRYDCIFMVRSYVKRKAAGFAYYELVAFLSFWFLGWLGHLS